MFNWQQNFKQQQSRCCWTLGNKIGGLATFFLVLFGGVSSYFYFEIIEISQEIEEIGQSDFPLYDNVTQLLLYQEQKRSLLEKIDYIQNYAPEKSLIFAEIAAQFSRIQQDINNSLSEGVRQSDFAFEKEQKDNIRLNQEVEDYQQLKIMLLQLEVKNQKFNLIIKELIAVVNSNQSSPRLSSQQLLLLTSLIQQAKVELKAFNQLTLEIQQRIKNHIEGSVVATVNERGIAIKTNALICFVALLFGLAFSIWLVKQITSSVNKVTQQAKFIADNIEQEILEPKALVVDSQDEIRDLAIAFNQMVENFLFSQAERKKIAQQLLSEKKLAQWQANHDVLTGLVNRREFERQFSQLWENNTSQVHSLLYMDLDRFKIINDTCGHDAGDELLRQISQVFQAQILDSNTLARLGGDEFAVILCGCSKQDALTIAEAILSTIQKFSFIWQERSFTIGISIGLISFKPQEDILTSVLKASDAACYGAKNSGRNQIYVMEQPAPVPESQVIKLNKI